MQTILKQRYGHAARPWGGTDGNERLFHSVRNRLVSIYLDGVEGISPYRNHRQVPVAHADADLALGREALAKLEDQKRAPTARSRRWMEQKIGELRRLLSQAEAVRAGAPQKMTEEDYGRLTAHGRAR